MDELTKADLSLISKIRLGVQMFSRIGMEFVICDDAPNYYVRRVLPYIGPDIVVTQHALNMYTFRFR